MSLNVRVQRFVETATASLLRTIPWTNTLGFARSLLALGTLLTLLVNSRDILFLYGTGSMGPVQCQSLNGKISLFCLVPFEYVGLVQIGLCAVLALVASGWRPRVTGFFHWYISFIVYNSVVTADGGEQVTAVLTFLMLPLVLTDPRKWHWRRAEEPNRQGVWRIVAVGTALLCQLQVALIYLDACLAKLAVDEWANGTALYYHLTNNYFGVASYLAWFPRVILTGPGVAVATWSALTLEFFLGINILLRDSWRLALFRIGVVFHMLIAVFIGIPTFAIAMWGALFLGVVPVGRSLGDVVQISQPIFRRARDRSRLAGRTRVHSPSTASSEG